MSRSVIDDLDRKIKGAKNGNNQALKKELKRRQVPSRHFPVRWLIINMSSRELLLIDARNDHVKKGVQSAYASKVPGGKLEVFCVSNTIYEKFSRKANNDSVRSMVTGSGIPDLRRFCHSIAAQSNVARIKTLPSILTT